MKQKSIEDATNNFKHIKSSTHQYFYSIKALKQQQLCDSSVEFIIFLI